MTTFEPVMGSSRRKVRRTTKEQATSNDDFGTTDGAERRMTRMRRQATMTVRTLKRRALQNLFDAQSQAPFSP
jgi:hypothetical protein